MLPSPRLLTLAFATLFPGRAEAPGAAGGRWPGWAAAGAGAGGADGAASEWATLIDDLLRLAGQASGHPGTLQVRHRAPRAPGRGPG